MTRTLLIALVALCLTAGLATAADWPHFLGPTRNSHAPDTGLNKNWTAKPPQLLWTVSLSDNGFAGPSVADGKVFIIDHVQQQDVVRALNLATGQEVWRYAYPEPGGDNYGFSRSTPSYAGGKLYTLGRSGTLNCLNAADGQLIWSKHLVRDFGGKPPQWLYAGSPLVDGNKVIVCSGSPGGCVLALNKDNGQTIWTGGNGDPAGYSTAVPATINGKYQYVLFTGQSCLGVDAETGQMLWCFPWTTKFNVNAPQPIIEGEYVFVTSGYNSGCATFFIGPQGPQQLWQNKDISSHFSSPIYHNGFIYSNSDPGNLVCMNPQQGTVVWKQPGFDKGGLIIADGCLIALDGRSGDLILAAAETTGYRELGRLKLVTGPQVWTAPILSDGKLIIRNKTTLACVDLK